MKSARPSDVSRVEHEFFVDRASDLYKAVLAVRFRGDHEGPGDARYMEAHVALGMALFVPDALVIDFSGLRLAGGRDFRSIIRPVEPNLEEGFPLYAVVSPQNREAVAEALPDDALVGSTDEALGRIRDRGPWALR